VPEASGRPENIGFSRYFPQVKVAATTSLPYL
jgi:hypothetical protein